MQERQALSSYGYELASLPAASVRRCGLTVIAAALLCQAGHSAWHAVRLYNEALHRDAYAAESSAEVATAGTVARATVAMLRQHCTVGDCVWLECPLEVTAGITAMAIRAYAYPVRVFVAADALRAGHPRGGRPFLLVMRGAEPPSLGGVRPRLVSQTPDAVLFAP